jgi:CheY-like chemotaxis protein
MVAWANRLSTILVVDDDASSRLVLRSVLEPSGYEVIEAPDGQAALDIIGSLILPDIVVTDLEMPFLGGAALISRLRGDSLTRAIPIVVVSGKLEAALALHGSGQVDAVVGKPVDSGALAVLIDSLARKSWMADRSGMGAD